MKFWIYGAVCLGGLLGCAQEHGQPADAGSCANLPECECNDGRSGTKVCDLDSHDFVMCECGLGRIPRTQDSGITQGAHSATDVVGEHAGQAAPAEAGRQAAGRGGAGGSAGLAPSMPAAGASGTDPVASPPNTGAKKGKGHNGRAK
jgi:hypothetical protein